MTGRICCFPHLGYLSETSRMIAVYKELLALNADVVMASHGGTYEWVLEEENIKWIPVDPGMDTERCAKFVKANRIDGHGTPFYETDELEETVRKEMDFLREHRIDLVLTGFNLSLGLSARGAGCLYAVSHLGSWNPIVFERRMQTPFNYLTYRIPEFVPRRFLRSLVNRIYLTSRIMLKPFNIVARRLGIEKLQSTLDMFMGDVTLVTEAPEILGISREELENWVPSKPRFFHENPRLRYTGPMYARLFGELPREVQDFLDTDEKKIYIAMTSTRSGYLEKTVAALASLEARVLVVSTVFELGEIGGNVMVCSHLPSHLVMPMMDLAVIHGGQGSVQTATASGIPAIIFPLQTEQMFNAQLVEDHGAGINLPLQAMARPEVIRNAALSILSDPSFRSSAEQMKMAQSVYDGPKTAADLLVKEAGMQARKRENDRRSV